MVGNNTYKRKGRRLQILLYIEFNELFSNLFNIFYLLDFQYLTSILMIFYLFVSQYFLPPPLHVARALPRPSSRNRLLPRLSLEATSQVWQSLLCCHIWHPFGDDSISVNLNRSLALCPGRSSRRCLRCGGTQTSCSRTCSPSTWQSSSSQRREYPRTSLQRPGQ